MLTKRSPKYNVSFGRARLTFAAGFNAVGSCASDQTLGVLRAISRTRTFINVPEVVSAQYQPDKT